MKKPLVLFLALFSALPLYSCDDVQELSYLLVYRASEGGTVNGKDRVLMTAFSGGDGALVTAIPNKGFKFYQWDDGWADADRIDRQIYNSFERIAFFIPAE